MTILNPETLPVADRYYIERLIEHFIEMFEQPLTPSQMAAFALTEKQEW